MSNDKYEKLIELEERISKLKGEISLITESVKRYEANESRYMKVNPPIQPGLSPKVAYDKDGRILGGYTLETSDIPKLNINHIIGLEKLIKSFITKNELNEFNNNILHMIDPTIQDDTQMVGTGIKINYNAKGNIVSVSDLLPEDIPLLPIEKISGLKDILDSLLSVNNGNSDNNITPIKMKPGEYTKVTVDEWGRIISGVYKLNMTDMPSDLLTTLTRLEGMIANLATAKSVSTLSQQLVNKVDTNNPIEPGTYTKIRVDKNGLVTKGYTLSKFDLPKLNINDIEGLSDKLRNIATTNDIIPLNESISSLTNSLSSLSELHSIKLSVESKASQKDLVTLSKSIKHIEEMVNNIIRDIPVDMIITQLNELTNKITDLDTRISIIELTK